MKRPVLHKKIQNFGGLSPIAYRGPHVVSWISPCEICGKRSDTEEGSNWSRPILVLYTVSLQLLRRICSHLSLTLFFSKGQSGVSWE
jgi:hypothetical protein